MSTSLKYLALTGFAMVCLIQTIGSQVRLNLSLMPDRQTYLVSMLPDQSWQAPMNAVGSAQIVIQTDAAKPFLAGQIKSLVPGVSWLDNAYVESPGAAPQYRFICFALNEPGTRNIAFQAGVETPLFSFVNLEPGCAGPVNLIDNNDPLIQQVVSKNHLNVTQNITVLGARGNAFSGIAVNNADCSELQTKTEEFIVSNLKIYPVPATDILQMHWELAPEQNIDKLLVTDMIGRQLVLETIKPLAGAHQYNLDVATFPTGLYLATLINKEGKRQSFRFTVLRQ